MRRVIVRAITAIVLGAVITVAVAWACAFLPLNHLWWDGTRSHESYPLWFVGHLERPGAHRVNWGIEQRAPGPHEVHPQGVVDPTRIPEWCGIAQRPATSDADPSMGTDDARGWPLLALSYSVEPEYDETGWPVAYHARSGIPISGEPGGGSKALDCRALPLRPIWSGFIVNTLLYTLLAYVLVFGAFDIRRIIRIRRGRCGACGFSMRGAQSGVCPECGSRFSIR